MSSPSAEPVFDREGLLRRVVGDEAFAREMVAEYLAQTAEILAELGDAIEKLDGETALRCAHTLKGSSASVGAELMRAVAGRAEALARQGDLPGAGDLLASIRAEFERFRTAARPSDAT